MKENNIIGTQARNYAGGGAFMSNSSLGMMLFIATEFMLFAGIIAGYFVLRASSNGFAEYTALPLGFTPFSTLVISLSSIALVVAQQSVKKNNLQLFKASAVTAFILGLLFTTLQALEWQELQATAIFATDNNNNGMFYLLSGLHGLHVFGGLVLLALLAVRAVRNYFNFKTKNFVSVCAIYWHFVTLLWLLLFYILFIS